MSGQIKSPTARISSYDEQITQLTIERDSVAFSREERVQIDETRITEINNEIKELRQQRSLQTKHLNRVLLPGIKTAIGFAMPTIPKSITLGIKAATPNPKPKPDPKQKPKPDPKPDPRPKPTPDPTQGSKKWIKNMLEKITNILIELGEKSLLALPGVTGAVVNFLLKSAASAVGFVAENLWTLIVAVGGLLYYE